MTTLFLGAIFENHELQNVLVHENGNIFAKGASIKALADILNKDNKEYKLDIVKDEEEYVLIQPDPSAEKASDAKKTVLLIKKGAFSSLVMLYEKLTQLNYPERKRKAVKKVIKNEQPKKASRKAPPKKAAVKKK